MSLDKMKQKSCKASVEAFSKKKPNDLDTQLGSNSTMKFSVIMKSYNYYSYAEKNLA